MIEKVANFYCKNSEFSRIEFLLQDDLPRMNLYMANEKLAETLFNIADLHVTYNQSSVLEEEAEPLNFLVEKGSNNLVSFIGNMSSLVNYLSTWTLGGNISREIEKLDNKQRREIAKFIDNSKEIAIDPFGKIKRLQISNKGTYSTFFASEESFSSIGQREKIAEELTEKTHLIPKKSTTNSEMV